MYITFTSICEEMSLTKSANLRSIVIKCNYQHVTMNMDNNSMLPEKNNQIYKKSIHVCIIIYVATLTFLQMYVSFFSATIECIQ